MTFTVIIPARYQSSRLPEKVLLPICGKPMIEHVYERAQQSGASNIIVATDHEKIMQWGNNLGAQMVMTDVRHPNGTSRVEEVIAIKELATNTPIVAIQADEPAINPELISACADKLRQYDAKDLVMVSAADPLANQAQLEDAQTVKVVLDDDHQAMYFSRAAIGGHINFKDVNSAVLKHIGIYAYYAGFLKHYLAWPVCALEQSERLEQLRALYNQTIMPIVRFDKPTGFGVDTQEDYQAMCEYLANH